MNRLKLADLRKIQDELITKYKSGLGTYELAIQYNTHPQSIRQVLIENDIIRRTLSENNISRFYNNKPLGQKISNCVDGWLLGDGSLHYTGSQAYFSFSQKHEEYVDYIINIFKEIDISCRKYKYRDKNSGTMGYKLFTESTAQFGELYKIWYPMGKKIAPETIKLSRECITHWIMDDGTCDKSKGHLRLCTCAFSVEECERLSRQLNCFIGEEEGCWVIEKEKYPRIYMPRRNYRKLVTMIDNCPLDCLKYKWNVIDNNKIKEIGC